MLKIAAIACAVCAGAGGAALWVKVNNPPTTDGYARSSDARPTDARSAAPVFIDAHANAHVDNLPVGTVQAPF